MRSLIVGLFVLVLSAASATAASITWSVNGSESGHSISGSYEFDTVSKAYSNVSLLFTPSATQVPPLDPSYAVTTLFRASSTGVQNKDTLDSLNDITLLFFPIELQESTPVAFTASLFVAVCTDFRTRCYGSANSNISGVQFTPTVNAVPLPATGLMLVAGLAGLTLMRRRKS